MFSKCILLCIVRRTLNEFQRRTFANPCNELASTNGLVLGMYENVCDNTDDLIVTRSTAGMIQRTENKLKHLIQNTAMTGQLGSSMIFNNIDPEFRSIAVVGLGARDSAYHNLETLEVGMENARVAAAIGLRQLTDEGCGTVHIDAMDNAECAAEGSHLANWKFQGNRNQDDRSICPKLELYDSSERDAWIRGSFKAHSQNLARDLCEIPSNQMTPTAFAQAAVDALCPCGVNVEVRSMDWIESQNMASFLSVAYSSCEPAVFIEINYCGGEVGDSPVLLAGSGLTFNSGGLALKPKHDLEEQRGGMAGAAVVVATIRAVAALSLPINVSAVIPLCENMPSGRAPKPGDIIRCTNGKTIANHNTNNADVMLLADALIYGQRIVRPKLILNIATQSEGVRKAFGDAAAGVFSNSSVLWHEMERAGAITGDRVWRLPLWQYFTDRVIRYADVDVSNTGKGKGSSCLGAAIIKEFITCPYWMHLDTRGVGLKTSSDCNPCYRENHMTGRPTRMLIQFLYQLACNNASEGSWLQLLQKDKS